MSVLYEFKGANDGDGPNANLVLDSAGNLYGTTIYKGTVRNCSCGTVFELSPTSSGPWKETTLYSFKGGSDGGEPYAGVIFDSAGNLYGTTAEGTVFELTPSSSAGWTEAVIYKFKGGSDGLASYAPLLLDQSGNLYGTTVYGGGQGSCYETYGCGVVFELTPDSGIWNETILYTFTGSGDGGAPTTGLAIDRYGDLYGETNTGGYSSLCGGTGCGTIFQLQPYQGSWVFAGLHGFQDLDDGAYPEGGLAVTKNGIVYGTTVYGGSSCNCGAVFEVIATPQGWSEKTLYDFSGNDGAQPDGVILDKLGDLYGTTANGGTNNQGTVFKLFP